MYTSVRSVCEFTEKGFNTELTETIREPTGGAAVGGPDMDREGT